MGDMRRSARASERCQFGAVRPELARAGRCRGARATGARWCHSATSQHGSSAGSVLQVRFQWSWVMSCVMRRNANIMEDPTAKWPEAYEARTDALAEMAMLKHRWGGYGYRCCGRRHRRSRCQ